MRNLDIADSRAKLELYAAQGQLVARHQDLVGELEPGGAQAISANPLAADVDDQDDALDRAAMESGTD
jgi:argininosuccinate synthase